MKFGRKTPQGLVAGPGDLADLIQDGTYMLDLNFRPRDRLARTFAHGEGKGEGASYSHDREDEGLPARRDAQAIIRAAQTRLASA